VLLFVNFASRRRWTKTLLHGRREAKLAPFDKTLLHGSEKVKNRRRFRQMCRFQHIMCRQLSQCTSQSSPIYGSAVFNLTFFNEVTRSNKILYRLHASVIDSCIDIIVGRPVIREHHLIQKILHYFDETTSSRPNPSQSVTPVTPSLAKLSRVCAQPCTTCTPFVLSTTPCRRVCRLTPIDESNLIERSQLLDAIADDDDIEWKTDPF